MTINGRSVAVVFERDFAPKTASEGERMAGSFRFIEAFRRDLGITLDSRNNFAIQNPSAKPHDFSLLELAQAFLGDNWAYEIKAALNPNMALLERATNPHVFEAGPGGVSSVVPGNIPNVSAFLGSVSGLLDAQILQGYRKPDYICNDLCSTLPTKTRQTRLIGLGRIGNQARIRNPGEGHPFAQFQDRRVLTPETQNIALACAVTFEAVFYDQTNEVLEQANSIGVELGLYEELDFFKLFSGTNNSYSYNGTSYNTYLTSGNWINDQVNLLEDWTNINRTFELGSRMTDQETGNRVTITYDSLVCSPFKLPVAEHIRRATSIQSRTKAQAEIREGALDSSVLWEASKKSPYLDQTLTAAAPDGLALSQANANEYWWMLNTKDQPAFVKTQNWPFTIQRAAPNDYTMLDHKLLLAAFADYQQAFSVREPRSVIRNKPA